MKTRKLHEAQENAGDQVLSFFISASDWSKEWRESSGPITEQSYVKPKQSRVTFPI